MDRKPKKKPNKEGWLNTYADMITLILVFFVLLYSISTVDEEKYRLLVKAFTADPKTKQMLMLEEQEQDGEELDATKVSANEISNVQDIEDIEDLYKYLKGYVEENGLQETMQVAKGDEMVYIRFMSSLFFVPDKAVLLPDGKLVLDDIGPALHMVENGVRVIRIDGHTAETPPDGNSVNDRDLSTNRANEVLKYLEAYYIEDRAKLMAVGYGRYRPVAPNDTEENMKKNRRVEILVSQVDIIQDELQNIYRQIDSVDNADNLEQ